MGEMKVQNVAALEAELEELQLQLNEANETIDAIRTGQVDAIIVNDGDGHQLYTLKTADHTYRVFIEKMNEGAVTLNTNGTILYSNSQFASIVQCPPSKVIGVSFEDFVALENKTLYGNLFKKCWTVDAKEELLLISGHSVVPVQLSLTALDLEEGMCLSIIITDLSAQKKSQKLLEENNLQLARVNKELEESNHDLQQFASVASHDLQEPLRKIQIFSTLIQDNEGGMSAQNQQYLSKVIHSSRRMKTLIIDILNYSRLSAHSEVFESVDLNELLTELLEDFELMVEEKNAKVQVAPLPTIRANRGQIRQVFQNLISNALKFTKENVTPVITVKACLVATKSFESIVADAGPFCLLTIEDNGIGFDKEKFLENIFALFERLNSKDKFEGTGIGLAIAKKIIDKHHGLITADSEEGKGSIFKIILPLA